MNRMKFHPHSENSKILQILIQTFSSVTAQTHAPNAPYACLENFKWVLNDPFKSKASSMSAIICSLGLAPLRRR